MNESLAREDSSLAFLEASRWKTAVSWTSAVILAVIFLVAGIWKITDAPSAAVRMVQALVPQEISLVAAISFGVAETFAGVLLLVPRFRRWGAWLAALMLVAFLAYIGYHYQALRGEECNCFPWVQRAVGPAFFIGDAIMLCLAYFAGAWSGPSSGRRGAILVLGAVTVFALVSYGVAAASQTGTLAPASISVQGSPVSLHGGKVFIYFFDPECMHCETAAQEMSKYNWAGTTVIAVPTAQPQFAQEFLNSSGLKAAISYDVKPLREKFSFVDSPAAVALVNGRQKALITHFEGEQLEKTLRELGFIR